MKFGHVKVATSGLTDELERLTANGHKIVCVLPDTIRQTWDGAQFNQVTVYTVTIIYEVKQ